MFLVLLGFFRSISLIVQIGKIIGKVTHPSFLSNMIFVELRLAFNVYFLSIALLLPIHLSHCSNRKNHRKSYAPFFFANMIFVELRLTFKVYFLSIALLLPINLSSLFKWRKSRRKNYAPFFHKYFLWN